MCEFKKGGIIFNYALLYQVHGDPNDFQRWTANKLELELKKLNFVKLKWFLWGPTVMHDLIHSYANRNNQKFQFRVNPIGR